LKQIFIMTKFIFQYIQKKLFSCKIIAYFFFFVFQFFVVAATAQNETTHLPILTTNNLNTNISENVSVLRNVSVDSVTYNFIKNNTFQANNSEKIHLQTSDSVVIIAFAFQQLVLADEKFIVEILSPFPDKISVYFFKNDSLIRKLKSGDLVDFTERKFYDRHFVFEFQQETAAQYTVLFEIRNHKEMLSFPIMLYNSSFYTKNEEIQFLLQGIYYGIIFAFFLLFLLVYLIYKQPAYIFFQIFIILCGIHIFYIEGFAFQFIWYKLPIMNNLPYNTFLTFSLIFLTEAVLKILNTFQLIPRLYFLMQALIFVLIVSLLLSFFEVFNSVFLSFFIYFEMIVLSVAIGVVVVVNSLKKKFLTFLFLISTILLPVIIIGELLYCNTNYGDLFHVADIKILIMFAIISFSFALVYHKKLQQDTERSEAIENLRELNVLKEETNAFLEKKIRDRTLQFQDANRQLRIANEEIKQQNEELKAAFEKSNSQHIKLKTALSENTLQQEALENAFRLIQQQKAELEKANVEIKRSSKLKEIFLANTSHEIRTPLNAIIGFVFLLEKTSLTSKQKDYIQNIKISGQNLMVVINDILDLSKIESGKIAIEKAEFDFRLVIKNLISSLSVKAQQKGVRFVHFIDPMAPEFIIGDPVRLNQILMNLLSNAIKFTDQDGEVKFIINLYEESDNEAVFEFNILDTGIGISNKKIDIIFDEFSQAEADINRKYGGTGLGLSIVKNLVSLFGGKIEVKSKENEGSSFVLKIPFEKGNGKKVIPEIQPQNIQTEENLSDLSILLVEDNQINQTLAIDTIHSFNDEINIDIAENGLIAIKKLKTSDYDIVLMDVQMPKMDGLEATLFIRNKLPEPKNAVPILGISAHAMKEEREECLKAGMNDYITKPFDADILFTKIKALADNNAFHKKVKKVVHLHNDTNYLEGEISNNKIIQLEKILKLYKGNEDKVKKILIMYLKILPKQLNELNSAFQDKDFEEMKQIAHTLKSSFRYIGMNREADMATEIEKEFSKTKNSEKLIFYIETLNTNWSVAQTEISEYLGR